MTDRIYRHFPLPQVSFAFDHPKGTQGPARIAVACCHEYDNYSRKAAVDILDTLLDKGNETIRAFQLNRNINVITIPYWQNNLQVDVIDVFLEAMGDVLDERTLYRRLLKMFLKGIVSIYTAEQAAKNEKNNRIVKEFRSLHEVLEPNERGALAKCQSLEEFERLFFDWRGSAHAVFCAMHKFSKTAWNEWNKEISSGEAVETKGHIKLVTKDNIEIEGKPLFQKNGLTIVQKNAVVRLGYDKVKSFDYDGSETAVETETEAESEIVIPPRPWPWSPTDKAEDEEETKTLPRPKPKETHIGSQNPTPGQVLGRR